MMKIRFNHFERVAGLFVIFAVMGLFVFALAVAIQRGVFEKKVPLRTSLENADGVREGTIVSMQGLRIGQVDEVELVSANEIYVSFRIREKYQNKIRSDSFVRSVRPFVFGEKMLEITVGNNSSPPVESNAMLRSLPTTDVMDLLSGRAAGPSVEFIERITENLKFVAEAFMDPKRSRALIKMFDEVGPLIRNASALTGEAHVLLKAANKDQQLVKVIGNMVDITNEIHKALPEVAKQSPEMLGHLGKIARNMAILTDELQRTLPAMQKIAPEIPRASERAIEALDETVVTLKALQKTFLLRSNALEVREEEATAKKLKQETERSRDPAATGDKISPAQDESK
jgi:phospholipid/cholesterol/gamma-HCH transport system substrate-binding protein